MYRIAHAAAASLLVLSLAACSGTSQPAQQSEPAAATDEALDSPQEATDDEIVQDEGTMDVAAETEAAATGDANADLATVSEIDTASTDAATGGPISESSPLLKSLEWPEDGLATRIPRPTFTTGTIVDVSETTGSTLTIRMEGVSDYEVADYVQALKAAGYVVQPSETSNTTSYRYMAKDRELVDLQPGTQITTVTVGFNMLTNPDNTQTSSVTIDVFVTG